MSDDNKELNKTATPTDNEAEVLEDTSSIKAALPEVGEIAPIVWPKAGRLWLETITVIIVAVALAIIIAAVDFGLRIGIDALTQL